MYYLIYWVKMKKAQGFNWLVGILLAILVLVIMISIALSTGKETGEQTVEKLKEKQQETLPGKNIVDKLKIEGINKCQQGLYDEAEAKFIAALAKLPNDDPRYKEIEIEKDLCNAEYMCSDKVNKKGIELYDNILKKLDPKDKRIDNIKLEKDLCQAGYYCQNNDYSKGIVLYNSIQSNLDKDSLKFRSISKKKGEC